MDREELNNQEANNVNEEIEINGIVTNEEIPEISESEEAIESNVHETPESAFEPQPYTPPVYVSKPQKEMPALKTKNIFAIVSMVSSIVALVLSCCCILSIPCSIAGIVFGILSLKSERRGMAIAGIVIGGITLVLTIVILIIAVITFLYKSGAFYSISPYSSHYNW